MHNHLLHLMRQHHVPESVLEQYSAFFAQVSEKLEQSEQDQQLLEHSLELTSQELTRRNHELKEHLTEIESTKRELEHSLSILNTTFDATGEAIIIQNAAGAIVKANRYADQMLGFTIGATTESPVPVMQILAKALRSLNRPSEFIHQIRYLGEEHDGKVFGLLETSSGYVYEYHSLPQMNTNGFTGRVWCFRNITEVKKHEALVHHHVYHDSLTNLPNRLLLADRIKHAISLAKRKKSLVGILFLDIDHFKKINDQLGHHKGDQLLCEFVFRIQRILREHDTVARLGGDEFVIILENICSYHFATDICHRILEVMAEPFFIAGEDFHISTSIGVSIYPRDAEFKDELIRKAHLAMHHAKEKGRNTYQYFDDELENYTLKKIDLEKRLRIALKNDELCLHYQPKIDLARRKVVGLEALLRWLPPDSPPIPPREIIDVAEQSGLILRLSQWVIVNVCKQIALWNEDGLGDFRVSLNLSTRDLRDSALVDHIKTQLKRFNVAGEQIEIEITETMFMEDINAVYDTLTELQSIGISVSVDDFGTGYSSMRYLQRLPIDYLKIDKSFVLKLSETQQDEAIIKSVINLGHNLKIKVVAEGVEDRMTALYLSEIDCDIVQGYYFYRPMPPDTVIDVLKGDRQVDF